GSRRTLFRLLLRLVTSVACRWMLLVSKLVVLFRRRARKLSLSGCRLLTCWLGTAKGFLNHEHDIEQARQQVHARKAEQGKEDVTHRQVCRRSSRGLQQAIDD